MALAWLTPGSLASDRIQGVASVVDGDTIEIHGTRIRLHGIDAPESAQRCLDASDRPWPCGRRAAFALADRIGRSTISCRRTDTDRYGRVIAVCSLGREDLNAWMVGSGWAVAFRRYSTDYVAQEERARARRVGIWASRFVMPWDWRRGARIVER
ncbi:thermonuclease family protein [Elioraea sp.]|uniref:thermonuclease family protein n=1 Tax=Elioraea sp. TaxID=2185103 RepID=UPI003F6FEE1F